MVTKRMNYYKGEFLHADDFQCEQDFHSSLRKTHNLSLHTSGIVNGLEVIAGTGGVTVKKGMAIDLKGRELILESDQNVSVASQTNVTIIYVEIDDPETDEGGFKGVKQKTVTCKVIAGTDSDGIILTNVTNASANPVTLDNSNRLYSTPVANGDMTVGRNLEVKGNLTVQGETTVVKTEKMRGNVELGDEDADTVTVKGILKTGHSSGKLKINSPIDISGSLSVTSGGELFFQDNGQIRSIDNNHRILFRRSENKLELREYGDIVFSPGATTGAETAKAVMLSNGNVGIGVNIPGAKLDVNGFTKSLGMSVNDASNTGVGRGLWLWNASDPNHVIYSANTSGKSPANNNAVAGFFGAGHRLRIRTAAGQGFLFENSNEAALVDIDSDDGRLWTKGGIYAGNSDIYFTKTDHNHSGIGNTSGYAAIENSANYNALMILGRATGGTPNRVVKLWDYLEVNGTLKTDLLLLGNKWRLSGVGDHEANDEWLRLKNIANNAYYGGFAASKFWTNTGQYLQSDIRLKKDITPIEKALGKVLSMRGVAFRWTDPKQLKQIGMIAQEVEAVIPEVVESGPDGFKGINYSSLIGLLIEAIKEQQSQIAELQKKLIPSMA